MAESKKRKKRSLESKRELEKSSKKNGSTSGKKSSSKSKVTKNRSHSSKEKQRPVIETYEPTVAKKVVSGIFNLLFYVVTIGLILSAVLFAFNDNQEKNILGYQVFNVRTNSMVPRDPAKQKGGFRAGDMIIIRNVKGDQLKEGDIVTFHPNAKSNTYLTHRLVRIEDQINGMEGPFMITQGDANQTEDSPTPVSQVVGKKVLAIPKLGYIIAFIRTHYIVSLVFVCSVFGSIVLIRLYLFQPSEPVKKKKSKVIKKQQKSY